MDSKTKQERQIPNNTSVTIAVATATATTSMAEVVRAVMTTTVPAVVTDIPSGSAMAQDAGIAQVTTTAARGKHKKFGTLRTLIERIPFIFEHRASVPEFPRTESPRRLPSGSSSSTSVAMEGNAGSASGRFLMIPYPTMEAVDKAVFEKAAKARESGSDQKYGDDDVKNQKKE